MRDEAVFPDVFQDALQLIAPGTTFMGLENILKARTVLCWWLEIHPRLWTW